MSGAQIEGLWTAEQVAEYLNVPLGTLYQWSHRRQGPKVMRVGRYLRYRRADVESWLKDQERGEAG
jgi:excisionase family DNA binding protein